MSSQNSHHQSSTSIKRHDLQFLRALSSSTSNPSTPSIDSSGPLTPDTVVLVNPFATLATTTSSFSVLRLIGDYELSETKLDDFKCARHIRTGEAFLYKEYPIENLRQRLEPYQRLTSLLLASNINKHLINSMTIEEIAARNHLHFFHDVLTHDKTGFVFYKNYTNNLHTYITDKHRLNENECRQLFSQIVQSIQMCHRVGLIIRDLKLRKIIFHNNNSSIHSQLLLTGLDEAIMLSSSTSNDDLVSSRFSCPVYACPEIVLNRQMYSGKLADSWSLGIILYTMLFGRYPFCDRTLVGLFIKIGRCRPDIPRTISIKARSLLRSLIRIKPDERLLSQDILGHVWFHTDRDLHSTIYDDSYSNSTNNHNSNEPSTNITANTEDAIVPNFQCE